jgi:hypothetical protein
LLSSARYTKVREVVFVDEAICAFHIFCNGFRLVKNQSAMPILDFSEEKTF